VLANRPALRDPDRPRFVGFRPAHPEQRLRAGAHLVRRDAAVTAENDEGVITSVGYSPSCGHWIGLGLLVRGPERVGERVVAADPVRDGNVEVEVCPPCFVDPKGERQHG
jgi:methylglutamate dehydrogenase subunit C